MTEEKEEAKKEVKKAKFEVAEVPTQMGLAVKDNESDEIYDVLSLLCKVANDVADLKKQLM